MAQSGRGTHPVGCQNSCGASELGFYPRRSRSSASYTSPCPACSRGLHCSPAATPRKTWRPWCCGTSSRYYGARQPVRSGLGRPRSPRCADTTAAPAPAGSPNRDTRDLARLAPPPGQTEMGLPEQGRTPRPLTGDPRSGRTTGPAEPAVETPQDPRRATQPGSSSRRGHDRTGHGGAHRPVRSRATRCHTSRPVSGTGMPKLWAYTSSRGTAVASTS